MLNIDKLLNLLLGVDIWYAGNTRRAIPCKVYRVKVEKPTKDDPMVAKWLKPVYKFYSRDGELLHIDRMFHTKEEATDFLLKERLGILGMEIKCLKKQIEERE